ncbi:cutinase family protein [Candidatus Saccharibacteria bacterium]|nr:cutinase family protein [Candidatus Saccharibacteria bacterium]
MRSLFKISLLFSIPILIFISSTNVSSKEAESCSDFEFIFARGSGQNLNDTDFKAFKSAISTKLSGYSFNIYELGQDGTSESYPAISVANFKAISVFLSAGKSYEFSESVEKGVKELKSRIVSELKRCKNKKFILAGYSQGALVINYTLPDIDANKIVYAATFGDPKLYLPEGKNPKSTACKNIGLSNYRIYVPDCYVEEGILTALKPYQQPEYLDKLGAFCNINDFMCGSNLNILNPMEGHTAYNSKNGYEKFAEIILEKIKLTSGESPKNKTDISLETTSTYSASRPKDIVVLFDCTQYVLGSELLKEQKAIVDSLRDKLVGYAEHGARVAVANACSVSNKFDGYSYSNFDIWVPFTSNSLCARIDEFNLHHFQNVFRYQLNNNYNNIYSAIRQAIKLDTWRNGADKHIIVITHTNYSSAKSADGTGANTVIESAKDAGVKISFVTSNTLKNDPNYLNIISETSGINIGDDFSKIKFSRNAISEEKTKLFMKEISLNQSSEYSVIVVNDVVYGYSREKTLKIIGLDASRKNVIKVIGYNAAGERISDKTYNINPENIGAPDCGTALD